MAERNKISIDQASRLALDQVAEVTGRDGLHVTGAEPTEDGWRVWVELIELRRIPDTWDLLGLYESELDGAGQLVSYRRTKRYPRGRAQSEHAWHD